MNILRFIKDSGYRSRYRRVAAKMAIRQKMRVVNSIIRIETVFVRTEVQYCRKYYLAVYNCRLCEIPSEDLPKYKEFIRELREKFYRDNRHIITKKKSATHP